MQRRSSSSDGSPPSAHEPSSTSKHPISSKRSSRRTSRSSSSYRSGSSSPRRRSKDRSKQDKIPSYQGAERSELKTITVDIRRTFPSDTSDIRDINPQDIVVCRRPGEGSRPLFDRDDVNVGARSDERRVISGSPSRSDRRSGSRRDKSRSRDRGRRRSHSRGRSSSSSSRSKDRRNRSRSRGRDRRRRRSKQEKRRSYHGAEANIPCELSELNTITVDIRRTFPSDTSANRPDINPQDIVVYRRPGEGSRPLFDRDDIRVCSGSDERRVISGSPSRSDRRSGSRRDKSRSRDRGRRRSHSRGRSSSSKDRRNTSRSRDRGRRRSHSRSRSSSRSKDRRNRSKSRRHDRRPKRPLIDTRYAHERPRSPVADERLRLGGETERRFHVPPMFTVTTIPLIRPMMYNRPPAIEPHRPFAGIPRVHRMIRYVPQPQPIYRPPPPAPPSL